MSSTRNPSKTPSRQRLLAGGLLAGLATTGTLFPLAGLEPAGAAPVPSQHSTNVFATSSVAPSLVARPVARPVHASRGTFRTTLVPARVVASGRTFTGLASWYGPHFNGQRTASGERFDAGALTAASPTLPFGTRLRVCRPRHCVVVRVNDRGPYVGSRVLDLSRAARSALGYSGVALVTATPITVRPAYRAIVPIALPHRLAANLPLQVPMSLALPTVPARHAIAPPAMLAVALVGTAGTGLIRGRPRHVLARS